MTTIHANISDAETHEAKHASTALLNQVLKANGDGTTRFASVAYSELTGVPSAIAYTPILTGASSATSQQPSATNTPLQIEFGPGGTSSDGSVTLSSGGVLTFNTTGYYRLDILLSFGRTDAVSNAILFHRFLYNGAQLGNSISASLSASAQVDPVWVSLPVKATASDTILSQIVRDAAGTNAGGLFRTVTSTSGWNAAPSAQILVARLS
jgi:hypothetical protein